MHKASAIGISALIIAVYAILALGRPSEFGARAPREEYYNLLVDGFRAGHLSLAREAPAGLADLRNPLDPALNEKWRGQNYRPDRVQDLSFFRGKLYLYFGATPALVLFWPYAALTGHYLAHAQAVFLFATLGFLATAALLWAVQRRHFPAASAGTLGAALLAAGLAGGMPVLLNRPDVWEVAITGGSAFAMLALFFLWRSLDASTRGAAWLAAASLSFGLAVGSRPSLLFGAPILLLPAVLRFRRAGVRDQPPEAAGARHPPYRWLAAGIIPIGIVGLGMAAYNQVRFGSPVDFGQAYQLGGEIIDRDHFGLAHLWTNLRGYFVGLPRLAPTFPFVVDSATPTLPGAVHGGVERPVPLLVAAPFLWLAGGALLLRRRPDPGPAACAGTLLFFAAAIAAPLCFYYGTCQRYELDFSPALLALAGMGLFALEEAWTRRGRSARLVAAAGMALAVVSAAFNLLAGLSWRAELNREYGEALYQMSRYDEAERALGSAVALKPASARGWLGLALTRSRRHELAEATDAVDRAAALAPEKEGEYRHFVGEELRTAGPSADLLAFLADAVRKEPRSATLRADYGAALLEGRRPGDAQVQLEEADRLEPANLPALVNLGLLHAQAGRRAEAIGYWRRALAVDPAVPGLRARLDTLERGQ